MTWNEFEGEVWATNQKYLFTNKLSKMTTEKTTALEMCRALLSITHTDLEPAVGENGIVVNDKLAADEISQLFLDAGIGGGVITGPYLQPVNGYPKKVWYISTH